MEPYRDCGDTSLITEISLPQQLFLKPEAKLNVTVALPQVRLPGKTISNWEVMARLKEMIQPEEFIVLRVSKTTLEFIRFDAEIENRNRLSSVISLLEGKTIKLSGFPELLRVKAAESKPDFPTRHDWDKYFRDAKNMNEMKPGERPDTIHIENIPSKWFVSKKDRRNGIDVPNEFTLEKVFEIFGEIRRVDIPMLDPYRNQMKASISGIKKFSHSTDSTFDAYIQYKEYVCFVKAMNALRGMKLVHRDGNKAYSASIKVDFDKTKHLSDMSIRKRKLEREKLMAKEREKEEEKRREEEAVRLALEEENRKKLEEKELKGKRQKEREEKRKQKILKKLKKKEAEQMNIKIAIEERKLLMAQRKLESIRLLDELFERVKQEKQREDDGERKTESDDKSKRRKKGEKRKKKHKQQSKRKRFGDKEKDPRKKLVKKIKTAQEQQMEERREKLKKTIEGKNKLRSGLKDDRQDDDSDLYRHTEFEYDSFPDYAGFDAYRSGYGYHDWNVRGFRGGFAPRRPYRGYRGGGGYNHYHPDWIPYAEPADDRKASVLDDVKRKSEKSAVDGMEDISSDSSSGSATYSHLDSSSDDEEKKNKDGKPADSVSGEWPEFEGHLKGDLESVVGSNHPWIGYADYYNPRFPRGRGPRRPRGMYMSRRGWGRGFPAQPNPNVPMNSFYMQSINSQYYKYFNKLAKGDYNEHDYRGGRSRSRSRSRSHSSERVVCRKVLSRSRSRSRRYSRSSRSRSSSRSRQRSSSKSRSKSKESDGSQRSRRRSESSRKRSKSGHRSRSRSAGRTPENREKESESRQGSKEKTDKSEESKERERKKGRKRSEEKDRKADGSAGAKSEESDWTLSLSGSDDLRRSPERKARPLGDPDWVPDRRERESERGYRTIMSKITGRIRGESYAGGYESGRNRYGRPTGYRYEERDDPPPNLRSHISRPNESSAEIYRRETDETGTKESKKSRHKKDKKRKRKYHEKDSKKRKGTGSD